MATEAAEFVKNCNECKNSDRNQVLHRPKHNPVPLPKGPWDKIVMDIKGPLQDRPRYLLVLVDYYSKWPEVFGLQTIIAQKVIKH